MAPADRGDRGIVPGVGCASAAEEAATAGAKASKGAVKLVTPRGEAAARAVAGLGRPGARPDRARPRHACGCSAARRARPPRGASTRGGRGPIFVRPGLRDPRGVLLHELGHVFDLKVMNNRDRGAFRRIMRRAGQVVARAEPLAEQFAEAYSWCARYARIVSIARYSSYDYRPTARQHKRICKLVRSAAGDRRAAAKPPVLPVVTRPHDAATPAAELRARHRSRRPAARPRREAHPDADPHAAAGADPDPDRHAPPLPRRRRCPRRRAARVAAAIMAAMDRSIAWRAGLLMALPSPRRRRARRALTIVLQHWGWLAGPGVWAACALVVAARAPAARRAGRCVGAALSGLPSLVARARRRALGGAPLALSCSRSGAGGSRARRARGGPCGVTA